MKILVGVKRVAEPQAVPNPKLADGQLVVSGPSTINPYCETALEAAIRLKEKEAAIEVVVVSVGEAECQEQLRTALALGADRAIHLASPSGLEPLDVARGLFQIYRREQPDLVLFGKLGIGEDFGQTGPMMAALAGIPIATSVISIDLKENALTITRDIDAGSQTFRLELPAVLTVELRLAEPRYATMPMIMRARAKSIEHINFSDLDILPKQRQRILAVKELTNKRRLQMFQEVDELVQFLTSHKSEV
jgi:electron transfer flavoprotein beta subunit